MPSRKNLTASDYIEGILNHDRFILSRAITLVESQAERDFDLAEEVVNGVLPHTGNAKRIGITGVPGVGKSTFIEALGMHLVDELELSLAVLAIDPSSQRSKGAILGDKTRMERLSLHPKAYIRPSATGTSLGGVASKTREAMLLCEAAGFDVLFIETVGVGQSEVTVKNMVDFFLLLMLAGAGDELQGIKKGIMEMADALVITKADGENKTNSQQAKREYQNALHLFPPAENGWAPKVLTSSAVTGEGLTAVWELVGSYFEHMEEGNRLDALRQSQNISWMHDTLSSQLLHEFYKRPEIAALIKKLENEVGEGRLSPVAAAHQLIKAT